MDPTRRRLEQEPFTDRDRDMYDHARRLGVVINRSASTSWSYHLSSTVSLNRTPLAEGRWGEDVHFFRAGPRVLQELSAGDPTAAPHNVGLMTAGLAGYHQDRFAVGLARLDPESANSVAGLPLSGVVAASTAIATRLLAEHKTELQRRGATFTPPWGKEAVSAIAPESAPRYDEDHFVGEAPPGPAQWNGASHMLGQPKPADGTSLARQTEALALLLADIPIVKSFIEETRIGNRVFRERWYRQFDRRLVACGHGLLAWAWLPRGSSGQPLWPEFGEGASASILLRGASLEDADVRIHAEDDEANIVTPRSDIHAALATAAEQSRLVLEVAPLSIEPWRNQPPTSTLLSDQAEIVQNVATTMRLLGIVDSVTLYAEPAAFTLAQRVHQSGITAAAFVSRPTDTDSIPLVMPGDPGFKTVIDPGTDQVQVSAASTQKPPKTELDRQLGYAYVAELLAPYPDGEFPMPVVAERLAIRLAARAPMDTVAAVYEAAPQELRTETTNRLHRIPAGTPGEVIGARLAGEIYRVFETAQKTIAHGHEFAALQRRLNEEGVLNEADQELLTALRREFGEEAWIPAAMERADQDLRHLKYLIWPSTPEDGTVDGGLTATKENQLLHWRKSDHSYTQEWLSNEAGHPAVVAVRRHSRGNGAGELTFEEWGFVENPRGMILICGVPDEEPTRRGREYETKYGGRQVAEALKHAQLYGPNDEVLLVSDNHVGASWTRRCTCAPKNWASMYRK